MKHPESIMFIFSVQLYANVEGYDKTLFSIYDYLNNRMIK